MSRFDWWRSHHGAPKDTKWRIIGRIAGVPHGNVAAVAWLLLDYASQANERGSITGYDIDELAEDCGYERDCVARILAAMEEKGFLQDGRISAWDRRQPKREDDSAERVRLHRARKSEAETFGAETLVSAQIAEPQTPASDQSPAESVPMIRDEAFSLASEIKVAIGLDPEFPPPSWAGCAMQIEAWLAKGWDRHIIIESIRAQMTRRQTTGPPGSIRYFERGIVEAHAVARQPLPEILTPKPSQRHGPAKSPLMAAAERAAADIKRGRDSGGDVSRRMLQDRRGE